MFKPVTDLRGEATVSACGRGEASRGVSAHVDVVLACRPPLALLFSPSPLDGVQRALYGERAAKLRTKAAHGSKETILESTVAHRV